MSYDKVYSDIQNKIYEEAMKLIVQSEETMVTTSKKNMISDVKTIIKRLIDSGEFSEYKDLTKQEREKILSAIDTHITSVVSSEYDRSMADFPRDVNSSTGLLKKEVSSRTKSKLNAIITKSHTKITKDINKQMTKMAKGNESYGLSGYTMFVDNLIATVPNKYLEEEKITDQVEIDYVKSAVAAKRNVYLEMFYTFSNIVVTKTETNAPGIAGDSDKITTRKKQIGLSEYYTRTYTTFSGCDMVVQAEMKMPGNQKSVFVTVGETQTVSYSIYRVLAPILNIGNINAKDYVGGPRTIAGSLIFTVFNRHWATDLLDEWQKRMGYSNTRKILMDEIAPINFTISMENEYGARSKLVIYGVRLFSEGQVMSINDMYTENTFQYVALNIDYMADLNLEDLKDDLTPEEPEKIQSSEKVNKTKLIQNPNDGGQRTDIDSADSDSNSTVNNNSNLYVIAANGQQLRFANYSDQATMQAELFRIYEEEKKKLSKKFQNGEIEKDDYWDTVRDMNKDFNNAQGAIRDHFLGVDNSSFNVYNDKDYNNDTLEKQKETESKKDNPSIPSSTMSVTSADGKTTTEIQVTTQRDGTKTVNSKDLAAAKGYTEEEIQTIRNELSQKVRENYKFPDGTPDSQKEALIRRAIQVEWQRAGVA